MKRSSLATFIYYVGTFESLFRKMSQALDNPRSFENALFAYSEYEVKIAISLIYGLRG